MSNDYVDDFELFNQMKEKQAFSNKSQEKLSDEKDKKQEKKNNDIKKIEKNGFDYYKILGLEKDASSSEIQRKYRKLLAKYHPDKFKDLPEKEKKSKDIQFQLVQTAGKILLNEDSKKLYDLEQKSIKNQDFKNQKNSFDEFIKMQESGITEENKQKAQLEFTTEISKLNKLRGFDPDKMKDKLNKAELDRETENLIARRDTDLIEVSHKNLFEGRSFDPSEFNKFFEKDRKKQEKKQKKKQENGEITKLDEQFTAFNDNGLQNYVSLDIDYSDPFGEDNFKENTLFAKLKEQYSVSDVSTDDEEYKDNYKSHNKDRDIKSTDDMYARIMKEREVFNNDLKDTKTAGYKDVMEDQFGISRQFGKMLGRDITSKNKPQKIDSDMVKVYNKMIGYESNSSDEE
jgi:curved DNA-binding protein CbpA